MTTPTTLRPLSDLAREALRDPALKDSARIYAEPYLHALLSCTTVRDRYGFDDAESLVRYALVNLRNWRGDTAREVKAALKAHL